MKISVAMATYNGEKYIKEQLQTILSQTVNVDEVIVSDDGSKDATLEIVRAIGDSRIRILTDNPHHGYCGNFEWAIRHTGGDVVFLADQDDVWMPNRVERTLSVFQKRTDIDLVVTNGHLINKHSERISGELNRNISQATGELNPVSYLNGSICGALSNGMCMCFLKRLKEFMLPFPDSHTCHDRWIGFVALCKRTAYYLDEDLVGYRIHDTNTSMTGSQSRKTRLKKAVAAAYNTPYDQYNLLTAMMVLMNETDFAGSSMYRCAEEFKAVYRKQLDAFGTPIWHGCTSLINLYLKNSIYKSFGIKYCAMQVFLIMFGRKYMRSHPRRVA